MNFLKGLFTGKQRDRKMVIKYMKSLLCMYDVEGLKRYLRCNTIQNLSEILIDDTVPVLLFVIEGYYSRYDDWEHDFRLEGDTVSVKDEMILYLISLGVDVNGTNSDHECTPLTSALNHRRSYKVIHKLIAAGADINKQDSYGDTPLICAIINEYNKELIGTLIELGASVNMCNLEGRTVLFYVALRRDRYEVANMLIDAGANALRVDENGKNVLFNVLCWGMCDGDCLCKAKKIIDLFLKCGASLKEVTNSGKTLLHVRSCYYLIYLCIASGISVDSIDNKGRTPLIRAVDGGDFSKVKHLLSFKADINYGDTELNTPLHYAYYHCSSRLMTILLFYGSNLFAANIHNKTPFDLCLNSEFEDDDEENVICEPDECFSSCDEKLFRSRSYWYEKSGKMSCVKLMIKYYLIYVSEDNLLEHFINRNEISRSNASNFIGKCKLELSKMRITFIKDDLSFYQFCTLRRYHKSEVIGLSANEFNYNCEQIKKLFPIYRNMIILRLKDNQVKSHKLNLLHSLENIVIRPKNPDNENGSEDVELIYDCKYLIGKYLFKCKHLHNLFLASIN